MPQLSCAAAEETGYPGSLMICVTSSVGFFPVVGATVTISDSASPEQILETLTTDESGQTTSVLLPAPNPAYSQSPSNPRPYTDYMIEVQADGYEPVRINGAEILPDESSILPVSMTPTAVSDTPEEQDIFIPDHTLYGEYPAKIPEAEIKTEAETGEIVLSRVVIPEYIIVHDGLPDDSSAPNYYVRYKDYIKNVTSSEIYATWPESTIYANILVIQSFTLNRVYTEWYRAKGYSFTITSSTAYDQKFIYGRNIYSNIDRLVDSIFANYLSRPGVRQPIFTSYCDGNRVSCQGLSQWGSKYLGDQGYSAIEIIRYYYGNDMYINAAQAIRHKGSTDAGAVKPHCTELPCYPENLCRRYLRSPDRCTGAGFSAYLQPPGNRNRGLSDLVSDFKHLCGGQPYRRAGDITARHKKTACGMNLSHMRSFYS